MTFSHTYYYILLTLSSVVLSSDPPPTRWSSPLLLSWRTHSGKTAMFCCLSSLPFLPSLIPDASRLPTPSSWILVLRGGERDSLVQLRWRSTRLSDLKDKKGQWMGWGVCGHAQHRFGVLWDRTVTSFRCGPSSHQFSPGFQRPEAAPSPSVAQAGLAQAAESSENKGIKRDGSARCRPQEGSRAQGEAAATGGSRSQSQPSHWLKRDNS